MPMSETVISIPVITLSVKAVRDVMRSLKVVFCRVSQNETRLEAVRVSEPLIKQVPACYVSI